VKSRAWSFLLILLIGASLLGVLPAQPAHASGASVHAVLLYSPTCPHCHIVLEEILPPLLEKYGGQLQVLAVNVSRSEGRPLFDAAMTHFQIASEKQGVPALLVGDMAMLGSREIEEKFPAQIEESLAAGGVDWPNIPGLSEALTQLPAEPADLSQPFALLVGSPPASEGSQDTLSARLARDPAGNSLAILVLAGMLLTLFWAFFYFQRTPGAPLTGWVFPVLCLIGAGVSGYLAYVETAQVAAICGPLGDCNTVQQSEYARLFGILPVGVLGLAGYMLMLLAWNLTRFAEQKLSDYASLALLGMTAVGTLFSIYLTFLEPFVIGATCAWCLTSAIIVTILFGLSLVPGKLAWSRRVSGRTT
jgi:uncharacterized membrane protein